MLFPVGIEDHRVNRLPWVSIGIAALCLLAFVATWLLPGDPDERAEPAMGAVVSFLREHPWLEVPDAFSARFFGGRTAELRSALAEAAQDEHLPDEATIAEQQAELEKLCAVATEAIEDHPLHRWALVPARGLFQPGWLTHLFLHAGLLHLLGNLFFFYLVGPLLEDAWGRPVFAGFYLVGGVFAAIAHTLPNLGSQTFLVGASGAVAACMGAFALRFAQKQVRIFYLFWIVRIYTGTFLLPAWGWGVIWFVGELWSLVTTGGAGGVAFLAHVGGFLFGLAVAGVFRWQRVEERWLAGAVEATFSYQEPPGVAAGLAAIERGEPDVARTALTQAIAADPTCGARLPLVKLELEAGRPDAAIAQATELFARLLSRDDEGAVLQTLEELEATLPLERLRPQLAFRLAQVVDRGPPGIWRLAERLYLGAAAAGGVVAEKALYRSAELRLTVAAEPEAALTLIGRARTTGVPQDERWARLEAQAQAQLQARPPPTAPSGLELATEGAPERPRAAVLEFGALDDTLGSPPPRVRLVRLVARDEQGLQINTPQGPTRITWSEVQALGVGRIDRIPTSRGELTDVRVLDLVLDWGGGGAGASVVRLPDRGLPPAADGDAFVQLCQEAQAQSGATVLPEAGALSAAELPRFATLQALEEACYGAAAASGA